MARINLDIKVQVSPRDGYRASPWMHVVKRRWLGVCVIPLLRGFPPNIPFEFIFYHLNLFFHDKEQVLAFLRWHLFRYLKGAIQFLCLLFAVLSISALSDSLCRAQFLIPSYPHWLSIKSIDLIRNIKTKPRTSLFSRVSKICLKWPVV